MGKRGPAPGSGKSGGLAAGARRGKGGDGISAALDRLESAIRAAASRQDIKYEAAAALWRRADAAAADLEMRVVCAAPDYPDEPAA